MSEIRDAGEHELARLKKLEELRAAGDEPYKFIFDRKDSVGDILAKHTDLEPGTDTSEQVRIGGRILTIRRHGKLAFADLMDGDGKIQLFARADQLGDRFESFADLDVGDWLGVWGTVMTTRRGELSISVEGYEIVAKCLRPLPEKWHGLKDVELRYRQRYLDLIANPRAREVMAARAGVVSTIRSWLIEREFIEVETPMLQPIPGGALAKPFVTFHNVLDMNLYLRVAPELYLKRLVVGGVEKVFELNRNFRNEGVSFQYNPEFTMLEAYQAWTDYNGMAFILESLVSEAALSAMGSTYVTYQGEDIDLTPPFRRARLIDLVEELGVDTGGDLAAECDRIGVAFDPKWPWGKLLVEIYEKKVEPNLRQPTFVMDYPKEVSPLAREHRSDSRFTEHLDLVICGMEVGVAYSELNDPLDQRARFESQLSLREEGSWDEDAHMIDEEFLRALEYGLPPTGGLGLGVDRLTMVVTDSASIRDVILFPALRPQE